jgi:type IV pilus assembly protein PilM
MSQQVIGLDIGTHSIKASVLRSRLRGFDLVGFFRKKIDRAETISESEYLPSVLGKFFSENRLRGDVVVASVSGLTVSSRIISLPFVDRRRIAQVIPFEVEGCIPFALEEVIVSHHVLDQGEGQARILGLTIKRNLLRQILESLAAAGVVPRIIDADFMALFNLSQGGSKDLEGCYGIVDMGEAKTTVCVIDHQSLGFVRSIPIAGGTITQAIAKEFGLSHEESERLKEARAALPIGDPEGLGEEEKRIAHVVQSAIALLTQEINWTFYAFEATAQKKVDRMFVCGGTSLLSNLCPYLSERVRMPVEPLPAWTPGGSQVGQEPQERAIMSQAYGLSLRALADGRGSQVNFLKDEFAYHTEIKGLRKKIVYMGIFLCLIVALFAFDGFGRYTMKRQRYSQLESEIRKIFKETFPETKQVGNELQQMKSKLQELQKNSQSLALVGGVPLTILDLIRAITERVPKGMEVDIDDFSFDAEKVRLSGRTDSFESVDRIVKALQGVESFEGVSLSNAKVDTTNNKVDFKLSMSLRRS